MTTLTVKRFAQIQEATVRFGDLTVLVGPQASGKSLMLQWFKMALDAREVVPALEEAGNDVKDESSLVDLMFGEGMSHAWSHGDGDTEVKLNGKLVVPKSWTRIKAKQPGKVFYIPAHRSMLLAEGWPAPFQKLNADTPVVARLFSQNLYQRFSGRKAEPLFPVPRILKEVYRQRIDDAVFHGGSLELDKQGLRYQLRLTFQGGAHLPFMAWTAGQREFAPMLLGLYHVLTPRKEKKLHDVDWVVVEEPEMGLHPQAIEVFLLLVLDMLWRGYKVVISTHSPAILEALWAFRWLKAVKQGPQLLCEAFDVPASAPMKKVAKHALSCDHRVYHMRVDPATRMVTSQDISELDAWADDDGEADWGGLVGFSSRTGDAVRKAALLREGARDAD